MVKNNVYSSSGRIHTFDDFYRNDINPLKSRSSSNDLISTNNSSSPSPTSPCSPNSNPYTFYNVFSDFKHSVTPDVVLEEDETENENDIIEHESHSATPVFYLEEDHHSQTPVSPSSSTSPNWPSLIFSRLRHSNNNHNPTIKQIAVNENQMISTKIRKNDPSDSMVNKHRFLKRSQTTSNANALTDKKSSTSDDFPDLSFSPTNNIVKKHRSFASLFHYFHHTHHQNLSTKNSNKSNSIDTLHSDNFNVHNNDIPRPKLAKLKSLPSSDETYSPVNKSSSTLLLPKITSFFQRHHLSEQHKDRVGNLKARLHHRRHSPPLTNNAPKFQCQASNELIQEVKQLEGQEHHNHDYVPFQRSTKSVVMKRVHTWHNSFDLRPVDQCLEY